MKHAMAIVLSLAFLVATTTAELITWNNASGGNWNVAANWNPTNVPDTVGEWAQIGVAGTYTVTLNTSPSFDWLDITNTAATLNLSSHTLTLLDQTGLINDGTILADAGTSTINGFLANHAGAEIRVAGIMPTYLVLNGPTVTNEGTIRVEPPHTWSNFLRCDADVTLQGSGTVALMTSEDAPAFLDTGEACTLTQAAGHTIHGHGYIQADMINEGTINADVPDDILELRYNSMVSNNNTMTATNGSTLLITGITITQGTGGLLLADSGSTVRLRSNATIVGGTFNTAGEGETEGVIDAYGSTLALTNVLNLGRLELNHQPTVAVTGAAFTNEGTIVVNADGYYSAYLRFDGSRGAATLQGSGVVLLAKWNNAFLQTAEDVTLTHAAGHTIRGAGRIEANLINESLIVADETVGEGALLEFVTNDKVNNAQMTAAHATQLNINNVTITQGPSGVILAESGGTVRLLSDAAIVGGTLDTAGVGENEGLVEAWGGGTKTLTDVLNLGGLELNNMATVVVNGAITNEGTIVVDADDYYSDYLRFDDSSGAATLQGNGTVLLAQWGGAHLQTAEGVTLTHTAGHTIRGVGKIDADLVNEGLIVADQTVGEHYVLELMTNGKMNNATMVTSNDTKMRITSVTVAQGALGVIQADDGNVELYTGAAITGGTLTSTGESKFVGFADATLSDITLSEGSHYFVDYYDTTTINGTQSTNHGTMECGNNGTLDVFADVDGTGDWYANGGTIRFNADVTVTATGLIHVGGDNGHLEILGADVSASDLKMDNSAYIAVGSSLTLSGDLDYRMTNEVRWTWEPAGTLIMAGTSDLGGCNTAFWSTLEIGDRDNGTAGPDAANFSLPNLVIADDAVIALSDNRNNGNGSLETLYVTESGGLSVGNAATLNLNGLNMYVFNGVDYTLLEVGPYGGGQIIDQPVLLVGDINMDGVVNAFDIDPFVAVLTGADPDPNHICAADINADGIVNAFDIDPFVALLTGG